LLGRACCIIPLNDARGHVDAASGTMSRLQTLGDQMPADCPLI
jgi:hypothetical protein